MANNFLATANRVAAHLGKAPKDFTKEETEELRHHYTQHLKRKRQNHQHPVH